MHGGLAQNTTRYYFLKSVDFTGNVSGFSSSTGAVTTEADPQDGATGATGATGADGDTGARYVTVRYYAEATTAPSTSGLASGATYTWSSGSATATVGSWTTSTPTVDAAGTNNYYYSDVVFIDSTGEATSNTGSSASSPVQLFNFNGLVTFTNTSGTTSLQDALDDNATTIDGGKITTNSIDADSIKIDETTISSDASGNLIIKAGGVGSTQFASSIQSTNYQALTSGWIINKSGSVEFQDATIRGTLNATDIDAGTLNAARINLTGSQLTNSGGNLLLTTVQFLRLWCRLTQLQKKTIFIAVPKQLQVFRLRMSV